MRRASHLSILLFLGLLIAPKPARAGSSLVLGGYYKNFTVGYRFPDDNLFGIPGGLLPGTYNRFRLNATWKLSDRISFSGSYDFAPRVQDTALNTRLTGFLQETRRSYRAVDFNPRLYPGDEQDAATRALSVNHNLDRAFVTVRFNSADLYVGRQAIAWGSARVVNPTDVIAPFSYNELDVEDRLGVDAVRLRAPIGALGEFDAGYIFGRDLRFENSAFFLRSKVYYQRADIAVLAVGFKESLLAGIDIARSLGGAGTWFEAGQVFAGLLSDGKRSSGEDYFRLSAGLDYTLRDGTYLFGEYHFSQAGSGDPSRYLENLNSTAYRDGAVYLLGRHYGAAGFTRNLTPLLNLGLQSLINLEDGSLFLVPNLEYNVAENIYISGGAYLGLGAPSSIDPEGSPIAESEFGSYADLVFVSVRIYY